MRTVKNFIFLMPIVVASMTAQQISDRAIVDRFTKSVKELFRDVDSAQSAHDCADVNALIEEMEKEFAAHKELLDRALYPDDYSKTITNLKGRLLVRQKDLGVIETQLVRIAALESQVRELSGRIDDMSTEVTNLQRAHLLNMEAAAMDRALLDSLKIVISRLRQSLRERDNLIFALVDSLFMQYDKDVASMNDVEKQGISVRLERRNVLTNIKKSLEDNLKFLESTNLSPNDYAEIARQNQRFSSQWNGLRPKITSIYLGGRKKNKEAVLIDSMLATWSSKVDQGTWNALRVLLEKGGIQLKPFSSGDEFTGNFSEFVAAEISNAKQEPGDVRLKRFNTFNDSVWKTDLEPTWLPVLAGSGKITANQKEEIEKKFGSWQSAIAPVSPLVYIVVAILLLMLLWSLNRYVRKKSSANHSP
ncbi:MAG TPA: hypothetical protein DEP53_18445 [Bacteroidetes bacterium]|nr:hypothetical protein [Bacteroidota bacterium]